MDFSVRFKYRLYLRIVLEKQNGQNCWCTFIIKLYKMNVDSKSQIILELFKKYLR